MEKMKCTHVRTPNGPDIIDVEAVINKIERQLNVDIKTLPYWKDLVKRLHVANTDIVRRIYESKDRKKMIIDKLYKEFFRPLPNEVVEQIAQTKWKMNKKPLKEQPEAISSAVLNSEIDKPKSDTLPSEVSNGIRPSTPPPNTEVPLDGYSPHDNKDSLGDFDFERSDLPPFICTNHHKKISPPSSIQSSFHIFHSKTTTNSCTEYVSKETKSYSALSERSTSGVICIPELVLIDRSLDENTLKVNLLNRSTETVYIKYLRLSPTKWFKCAVVCPRTDVVLRPGLTTLFNFTYRLRQNETEFTANLEFKVGHRISVHPDMEIETLSVPLVSTFTAPVKVDASENVFIPPVYPWQIVKRVGRRITFPTGYLKISVQDDIHHEVTIKLREDNMKKQKSTSLKSIKDASNSSALGEYNDANKLKPAEFIKLILLKSLDSALEPFMFKKTFAALGPRSKIIIPVYLTKWELMGAHQRYYDLYFKNLDAYASDKSCKKTVKVYGEVLPHPIQMDPIILDMTQSPVKYGFCEDMFRVINNNSSYAFNVKIKLTTKMKKLFSIVPTEVVVQSCSAMPFIVRFCSREFHYGRSSDKLAHFVIKVSLSSYKPVFGNVPPIYYEIIAPLALEFQRVYSQRYYSSDTSLLKGKKKKKK